MACFLVLGPERLQEIKQRDAIMAKTMIKSDASNFLFIIFIVAVAKDQFVSADDGKLEFLMLHALKLS